MALRLLTSVVLVMGLAGCATAPHSGDYKAASGSGAAPIIIRYTDIEPSAAAPDKLPKAPPVKAVSGTRHTAKAGETLWAISKIYNVDVPALVNANSLSDSGSINKGQVLVIPGASRRRAARSVNYIPLRRASFTWPVRGQVASRFGSKADSFANKGIDIRADNGASVLASRGGKVVYCDSRHKGFGQTVIIDHMDGFQTVYSYNSQISVNVGDLVEQKDVIARVGASGRAKEPMLHFEIRKNGEPQNPEFYLSR